MVRKHPNNKVAPKAFKKKAAAKKVTITAHEVIVTDAATAAVTPAPAPAAVPAPTPAPVKKNDNRRAIEQLQWDYFGLEAGEYFDDVDFAGAFEEICEPLSSATLNAIRSAVGRYNGVMYVTSSRYTLNEKERVMLSEAEAKQAAQLLPVFVRLHHTINKVNRNIETLDMYMEEIGEFTINRTAIKY